MPDIDFDKITLSKSERKALKLLTKNCLLLDDKSKKELNRLVRLELADKYPANMNGEFCWGVKINDNGEDYFAYTSSKNRKEKSEKRRSFLRDLIFLVLGGLITVITEHITVILAFVRSVFQHG